MVSAQSVNTQLKRLKFNPHGWGSAEVRELPKILMPDEEIYECANGMYEGGFALLVATDSRLLLIDKKPLNYLSVEDMRFDTINELDYSHRVIGARISISAGSKNLVFKSYNQPRLRKLITHVQHFMANSKKQQFAGQVDQKQHLEQINQQLQTYLIAQHEQQKALREQLERVQARGSESKAEFGQKMDQLEDMPPIPEVPKLSPELSDYLFAQSLLKQYREQEAKASSDSESQANVKTDPSLQSSASAVTDASTNEVTHQVDEAELYTDGTKEIFKRQTDQAVSSTSPVQLPDDRPVFEQAVSDDQPPAKNLLEVNPLTIAYSKLPMALRNRKFGRPSFHAHSRSQHDQNVVELIPLQSQSTTLTTSA